MIPPTFEDPRVVNDNDVRFGVQIAAGRVERFVISRDALEEHFGLGEEAGSPLAAYALNREAIDRCAIFALESLDEPPQPLFLSSAVVRAYLASR